MLMNPNLPPVSACNVLTAIQQEMNDANIIGEE